jgi:hypothetical protein
MGGITALSALPSLIASQFVAGGQSSFFDREIKWGLIQQDDNGLAVVSETSEI